MAAYTRIRTSVRNGLAVVSIERASAGSFFTILKRRLRLLPEKIIIDEHSGRILVDSVLADEEKKRWKIIF
jgi:hypothetical protein